jgi:hypothetical protein
MWFGRTLPTPQRNLLKPTPGQKNNDLVGKSFCVFYFMALSAAKHITLNARMTDGLERIWKETVVA